MSPMVRAAELGDLFTRITMRNTARVVSRALAGICRPKKSRLGGCGIGADMDGLCPRSTWSMF
eukprot:11068444-Lingulodinium_polyedra.AAC.1